MLGRQVAARAGRAALLALAACGPPASRPATVEIASAGAPAVLVREAAPRAGDHPSTKIPPKIAWETSERDARARARRLGLPMIVWARADWAAAALEMERKTWADPRVAEAARGFVALRLDLTEAEGDAELLARQYGVDTMPTTILVGPDGMRRAVIRGYVDADALLPSLAAASR